MHKAHIQQLLWENFLLSFLLSEKVNSNYLKREEFSPQIKYLVCKWIIMSQNIVLIWERKIISYRRILFFLVKMNFIRKFYCLRRKFRSLGRESPIILLNQSLDWSEHNLILTEYRGILQEMIFSVNNMKWISSSKLERDFLQLNGKGISLSKVKWNFHPV